MATPVRLRPRHVHTVAKRFMTDTRIYARVLLCTSESVFQPVRTYMLQHGARHV